jgi:NAD+ synthase (glutamine-hydrolysing)
MTPVYPRIALCQMRVHPGEPRRNAESMLAVIEAHRAAGDVDLIAFPEMAVPGYLLGDTWEREAFLRDCEAWNERIIGATADGPAVIFGTVAVDESARGEDGRSRKYNAWIFAANGRALEHPGLRRGYGIKTLQPNYREFEDARHFYDARRLAQEQGRDWRDLIEPVVWHHHGASYRVGVLLCEDAWEDDYAQKPVEALAAKRPDFTFNLSASPFTRGKNDKRNRVFGAKARLLGSPLLYVNAAGIQNNGKTLYTFDGSSTVYSADGAVLQEAAPYQEAVTVVKMATEKSLKVASDSPSQTSVPPFSISEVHRALRYGAEKFLDSTGLRKVVIGVSGGIDSAVSAALFAEFLGPEELLLVNMPSRYNSETTKNLAKTLAANLGCLYTEIPIEESLRVTLSQIGDHEVASVDGAVRARLSLEGTAFENTQARDRGARLLAALAASFGGVFVCNANKAELTVGYGTLYGDIAGFLAPLGDLWKHDVYALGRHLNEAVYGREVLPSGIFDIVPSAELGDHHAVDEGKGDPLVYPYHDRLFYSWVQRWKRATPEEILEWYLNGTLAQELQLPPEIDLQKLFPTAQSLIQDLERWWNLYTGVGVVKRVQAPPILAVSSRAFGYDHREYLGRPVYTERYLELKKRTLS